MATREVCVFVCDGCGAEDADDMTTRTVTVGRKTREVDVCGECSAWLLALLDAGRKVTRAA